MLGDFFFAESSAMLAELANQEVGRKKTVCKLYFRVVHRDSYQGRVETRHPNEVTSPKHELQTKVLLC